MTYANNKYHILVIDDDSRLRELLKQYLEKNNFLVSIAEDTIQARKQMKRYIFDLLVVDIMMPSETGLEFVTSLRKEKQNFVPVLMLTAMGEVDDRIKGLETGADDYLVKPFEPKELVLRIKSILSRANKDKLKDTVSFGDFKFNLKRKRLSKNGESIYVTDNEANLLSIFCRNNGVVLSREKLCEMCDGVNERSIDVQITRLRKKIEDNPRQPKYLQTIRGKGYVFYK